MLKALAEKKGGGSFLRTLCGRTGRGGGGKPPSENVPPPPRHERGAAP